MAPSIERAAGRRKMTINGLGNYGTFYGVQSAQTTKREKTVTEDKGTDGFAGMLSDMCKEDGVNGFDRTKMGNTPKVLPSFVGRVFTEEELYQYVDDKVQSNQDKKKSLFDMLKESCPEGTNATFRFAGESKIYNFYDFIDEFEKRSEAGRR